MQTYLFVILSVLVVSLASLLGAMLLFLGKRHLDSVIFVLVSFAVGSMLGNVLFDLVPESYESIGDFVTIGWLLIAGFLLFFVMENVHSFHRHKAEKHSSFRAAGYMNLIADGVHNFTDGVLIAASWLVSPEVGLSTSITILLHELPQELSDFGVLLKAGFSKGKALLFNFLSALTAVLGAVLTLALGSVASKYVVFLLPVAAGCFIYLSLFSLLPLIVKGNSMRKTLLQILIIVFGVVLMYLVAE